MNYYGFISLFNGIVALILGLTLFFYYRRNAVYMAFVYMTLSIAAWSITYAVWQVQTEKRFALAAMQWTMVTCYFIPAAYLWFVRHVVEDVPKIKFKSLYIIIPLFFALSCFSPLMIADVHRKLHFPFWPEPGKLFHIAFILFNGTVVYATFLLVKAWWQASGPQKWQLQWIALCMIFMWGGGLTNWFLWYDIPVPPVPNFFVAVFLLLIGYGVTRRQLFDVGDLANIVQEAKLSAIGMLTTSMNHEIRNPLYIIKGQAESFLSNVEEGVYKNESELADRAVELSRLNIEQTNRAIDIMSRFSHFSKQSVRKEPQPEQVNLKEVLDLIVSLVEHELTLDKIDLNFQIPDDCRKLLIDRRHLEEVLFNLLVNACQALKKCEHKGLIKINVTEKVRHIYIQVSDNGPGLSAEQLKKLFEPFYTTKEEGTGLGLYIAKRLVEKNNGRLSVESAEGEGTTFQLELIKA